MINFQQKRKLKLLLASRYVQLFVLFLTALVAWSAFTRYQIAAQMSDRRSAVEQEAAALQVRKDSLQEEVNYLSDERGIEAEMRRQFDVAKEGEKVVVIVDDEPKIETIPIATSTIKEKSWYEFWR